MTEIRRIDADGWGEWRHVRREALAEAPTAFSSTLSQWSGDGDTESRWRARLDAVPLNLIAEVGGRPAGMVSCASEGETGDATLTSMWVSPEHRGSGVGGVLVDAVLDWARDQGCSRVTLEVRAANRHAIALYERHGFVDAGTVDAGEPGSGGEGRGGACTGERRFIAPLGPLAPSSPAADSP